eukprot:CAMPEP_0119387094 /NCGR_PEP_ID=MMETSP1334-20130426/99164_1 /TAXON_ID=127549 /ORGANISM="Calcidiscus leptoporus, Strain RCC1130" /LENGTH=243 /DNA_ID=CAMNT_0007408743 /DNA_START=213 /DNA_END=941 /DNA_ORIENTATION=-
MCRCRRRNAEAEHAVDAIAEHLETSAVRIGSAPPAVEAVALLRREGSAEAKRRELRLVRLFELARVQIVHARQRDDEAKEPHRRVRLAHLCDGVEAAALEDMPRRYGVGAVQETATDREDESRAVADLHRPREAETLQVLRVPRRARDGGHLLADEGIEQRGLAHVGMADKADGDVCSARAPAFAAFATFATFAAFAVALSINHTNEATSATAAAAIAATSAKAANPNTIGPAAAVPSRASAA